VLDNDTQLNLNEELHSFICEIASEFSIDFKEVEDETIILVRELQGIRSVLMDLPRAQKDYDDIIKAFAKANPLARSYFLDGIELYGKCSIEDQVENPHVIPKSPNKRSETTFNNCAAWHFGCFMANLDISEFGSSTEDNIIHLFAKEVYKFVGQKPGGARNVFK